MLQQFIVGALVIILLAITFVVSFPLFLTLIFAPLVILGSIGTGYMLIRGVEFIEKWTK